MLQKAYGNETLNRSKVFRWYSRFRDGRELVEDDERWPSKINSNWGKHCYCCWFGQKWSSNRIKNDAKSLNIPKTVVLRILEEDLGKRKLCARFVPQSLTPERREDRVTSCQDIIAMADADKNVFKWDLVICLWPRLGRMNWNSKGPESRSCWQFFPTFKVQCTKNSYQKGKH